MRVLLLLLAAASLGSAAAPPTDPAGRRIVGEWRGTSLCTHRELAPACKDETVRYVFTGPKAGTNTYHLVADKLVNKVYETMGEMDFDYSAAESTWTCELETRRHQKLRWWYRLEASRLVGGLITDHGDTLRVAAAARFPKSSPPSGNSRPKQ